VDENLVQQEDFIDGRFLMFCTDQRISAKNVFTTYFQRDEIEKAFKSLKGELSLGPFVISARNGLMRISQSCFSHTCLEQLSNSG